MDSRRGKNKETVDGTVNLDLYFKLIKEEERLDEEISKYKKQGVDTNLKPQMELLHKYNHIKDVTQHILGYIADIEQTTVTELHKLFNLPLD